MKGVEEIFIDDPGWRMAMSKSDPSVFDYVNDGKFDRGELNRISDC